MRRWMLLALTPFHEQPAAHTSPVLPSLHMMVSCAKEASGSEPKAESAQIGREAEPAAEVESTQVSGGAGSKQVEPLADADAAVKEGSDMIPAVHTGQSQPAALFSTGTLLSLDTCWMHNKHCATSHLHAMHVSRCLLGFRIYST